MIFREAELPGVFILEPEKRTDERGFFSRLWCGDEFEMHGLNPRLEQCSLSYNEKKGTLRGMHFQKEPYAEDKLLFCATGAIYDVVMDLRGGSPSFKRWMAVELSRENRKMLYVPKGFAHGFLTLEPQTEVFYFISAPFRPEYASGVRWDDAAFGIKWPKEEELIISEKDRSWPLFTG